jgi:hypothetical protein
MAERCRSKPGTNVWHSTSRCSQWPLMEYWSHARTPVRGVRCSECVALEDRAVSEARSS